MKRPPITHRSACSVQTLSRYRSGFCKTVAMGLWFVGVPVPCGRRARPWPSETPFSNLRLASFRGNRPSPVTAARRREWFNRAVQSCRWCTPPQARSRKSAFIPRMPLCTGVGSTKVPWMWSIDVVHEKRSHPEAHISYRSFPESNSRPDTIVMSLEREMTLHSIRQQPFHMNSPISHGHVPRVFGQAPSAAAKPASCTFIIQGARNTLTDTKGSVRFDS